MEEHISQQGEDNDNEQDEDAEEMEQSGESNEGHSSNDCIIDNELNVLPLQRSKNKVWSYFGFPAVDERYREEGKKQQKEMICCVVGCKKIIKYSGNTTNLLFQLQHMHSIAYDKVMQDQKQYAPSKIMPRQLSLTQAFEKGTPLAKT